MRALALLLLVACTDPAPRPPAPRPAVRLPPRSTAVPPPLPDSLAGTEVDGSFDSPADTRRLFDYFLLAEGEEPLAVIRARITALDASAGDLFDRYVAYRREGAALLEAHPEDPVGALASLQRAMFGTATAEAMFGADLDALADALTRAQEPRVAR